MKTEKVSHNLQVRRAITLQTCFPDKTQNNNDKQKQ